GQAARLDDSVAMIRRLGTAGYVAPEVLNTRSHGYGSLSDVFSAGAVCFFVYSGLEAFRDVNHSATIQRTLAGKARFSHPKAKQVRTGTLHLLKKMLAASPKKRPRAAKACKALWNLGTEEVKESPMAYKAFCSLPLVEEKSETASFARLQPVAEFQEEEEEGSEMEMGFSPTRQGSGPCPSPSVLQRGSQSMTASSVGGVLGVGSIETSQVPKPPARSSSFFTRFKRIVTR
ncbi:unnamed protein product, partial [Effrenium voratum]